MDVVYERCAGLDVHKKSVVACCITPGVKGQKLIEVRTFGAMTADLLVLSGWLAEHGITHVAMESTGELWKPVYNILEGSFEILVVNAKHIKNVPGRKTDVKDAEWIADLLRHGLLRSSFVPPQAQRDLRDLTRQRTNLVQDRTTVLNRLQKVLEWANLKLTSVASDVSGVSARAILEAILAGQCAPEVLADLARGKLRNKRAELERALSGRVRDHHRFLIANHLAQIDFLEEQIAIFDAQIIECIQRDSQQNGPPGPDCQQQGTVAETGASPAAPLTWEAAVELLDTIPGVGRRTAELLVSEIGTDMQRFPSAAHLASWAKLAPGNNESAGKRYSSKTGMGNRWLRSCLVQAAHAAVRVKDCYLSSVYHRLVGRRGVKRAIIAVAHHILVAAYYMLLRHQPFRNPDASPASERNQARTVKRLTREIEKLGYRVVAQPMAGCAPPPVGP